MERVVNIYKFNKNYLELYVRLKLGQNLWLTNDDNTDDGIILNHIKIDFSGLDKHETNKSIADIFNDEFQNIAIIFAGYKGSNFFFYIIKKTDYDKYDYYKNYDRSDKCRWIWGDTIEKLPRLYYEEVPTALGTIEALVKILSIARHYEKDLKFDGKLTKDTFDSEVEKFYLRVAYDQKEEAKQLGARWDYEKRVWFCTSKSKGKNELIQLFG